MSEGFARRNLFVQTSQPETTDISAVTGLRTIEAELNTLYLHRQEAIRSMIMAVMTGEQCLLIADTGAAKTHMMKSFARRLEGKQYVRQTGIDDRAENLFGPIDPITFREKGRYRRKTDEGLFLQEADLAFFDEIFDAPDQILRLLLRIFNEKEFQETSGAVTTTQFRTAIAAANYLRVNAVTKALVDRFMFTPFVRDSLSAIDLMEIALMKEEGAYDAEPARVMTLDEIDQVSAQTRKVILPAHIRYIKDLMVEQYNGAVKDSKERISGRRALKMDDAMRAYALLEGDTEVGIDELRIPGLCIGAATNATTTDHMSNAARHYISLYTDGGIAATQMRLIGGMMDRRTLDSSIDVKTLREKAGIEATIPQDIIANPEHRLEWLVRNLTPADGRINDLRLLMGKRLQRDSIVVAG